MKNRSFLLFITFLLLIKSIIWADDLQEATNIALKEYRSFIYLCLDPVTKKQFNLTDSDEVGEATLGEPMQLMIIPPEKILNFEREMTIDECTVPIKSYYFPVIFNNSMKLIITVNRYKAGDNYEIGSLGLDWLAKEIILILREFPLNKGYTPVLCQNPATQYYSFHIPQKDKMNLTIIHPGANGGKSTYSQLSSLEEAMVEYQELLKNRLPLKELK